MLLPACDEVGALAAAAPIDLLLELLPHAAINNATTSNGNMTFTI
ncbi:MAG TPA: hypothetical protein VGY97_01370 [Solirubrobacteraceae bacterium]|nr:hypothetical protein [Solirubrobacteraceae bacterium]